MLQDVSKFHEPQGQCGRCDSILAESVRTISLWYIQAFLSPTSWARCWSHVWFAWQWVIHEKHMKQWYMHPITPPMLSHHITSHNNLYSQLLYDLVLRSERRQWPHTASLEPNCGKCSLLARPNQHFRKAVCSSRFAPWYTLDVFLQSFAMLFFCQNVLCSLCSMG